MNILNIFFSDPERRSGGSSRNKMLIIAIGGFLGLLVLIVTVLLLLHVTKKTDLIRKISSRVSPESNLEMEKRRQMEKKKKKRHGNGKKIVFFDKELFICNYSCDAIHIKFYELSKVTTILYPSILLHIYPIVVR